MYSYRYVQVLMVCFCRAQEMPLASNESKNYLTPDRCSFYVMIYFHHKTIYQKGWQKDGKKRDGGLRFSDSNRKIYEQLASDAWMHLFICSFPLAINNNQQSE